MINQEWKIKGRAHACSVTGQPFVENEPFYTALFEDESDEDGFIRRDYCVAAWQQERPNLRPFSHWRSLYEPPQQEPSRKEIVEKEGAEALLRRLIEEDDSMTENTRFILALMLERKKTLRETDSRNLGSARLRIYEHAKSGEVFIIRDPQLKLDQLESIQREVAERLGARPGQAPPPAPQSPEAAATPGDSTAGDSTAAATSSAEAEAKDPSPEAASANDHPPGSPLHDPGESRHADSEAAAAAEESPGDPAPPEPPAGAA